MNRVLINKADEDNDPKIFRLEDLETMFVSLVDAGANRQKKFFVVKADEAGLGPGGVCVCPECGYEMEHTNRREGKQCNEEKCPECGTTMTRKDSAQKAVPSQDASSDDLLPVDLKTRLKEKNGEGEGSEITPQDGVDAEGKSKSDLDFWLEDAGTRADAMLVDLTLELESAANPSGDATKSGAGENNALVIGDGRAAPSEDRGMDAAAQLEQDLQKARDEAKAKAIEANRLKKELDRRDRDLKKERSRVAALKSTIGAATALPTGEMLVDIGSDEPPSWAGDLAEEDEA